MEYLDLYDENRNLIGEKILRSRDMKIEDGKYIYIVIVFIQNSEGKFLIQKTSKEKESIFENVWIQEENINEQHYFYSPIFSKYFLITK